jgi:hypothetical protein
MHMRACISCSHIFFYSLKNNGSFTLDILST